MRVRSFVPMALLCLASIALTPVQCQEARGVVVGKVTDSSGAAIPAATVQVTNKAMGVNIPVQTNESGSYQAPFLIPGSYVISVEIPGFKKFAREVEVRVNDRLDVNVTMEVGVTEQSVTVTSDTPLLNTASASVGQVIDSRRVAELPIAHGNPYQLIGLAAGVTFSRDARLDRPFEPTHIVGYSVDGTRANRSDITIDGAPSTATANANEVTASYVPPADIVQEFKVQTATFDASSGQTEGGVTNISLKSGTNTPHGTAYYNKMAPELFANDFFANANRVPRPDFSYDRWGASFGAPIVLPKLYNGKDKTFVMSGYEGIKEGRPRNNGTPTVPTEKMKAGDFSDFLALPNGSAYRIFDPATRRTAPNGRVESDPFPGNIIPPSRINPVAKSILQYFPKPLTTGNADGTNNYQRPELTETANYWTHSARVDHVISDKQRIYVRGSLYNRDSDYNNYFDNLATGEWFQFQSRAAVIDDVYTLSPTTVLNVRYGYNRFIRVTNSNPENRGFDLTSLGFPSSYNNLISESVRRFPRVEIAGYQGTGVGGEYRPNDTHSFFGSVQKSQGSHYMKAGVEFRAYRENATFFGNDQTGRFNFDSTWTRGPLDNSPTSPNQLGQSFASFLLGLPASTNSLVGRAASYSEQSTSWGVFFHDDWRVNSRLTLNLGLRWEVEGALTERFNRSVRGFDTNIVQPFEAAARARYAQNPTAEVPVSEFDVRGGLTFAGVDGQPRSLYETPKGNFMPRFGLAYKLNDKTVMRGGYGIFYGFLGQRRGDVIQSGFSRNTQFIPSLDNGLTFISTLSNPFPDGILEPVGASQGPLTFVGQSITYFNEKPEMTYNQRWQFGFQRELGRSFVADLAYVGNRGTNIEISQNLNVTPQRFLSTSPGRDNDRINYLSANVPNPFAGLLPAGSIGALTGNVIARERLLRPFPQYDAVNQARFDGYSWYHSLQAGIEKRFSAGYTFNANYTYSKYMQATEVLNQDDARPTEVISDFDRPHRLTASGIYELPFGKGKLYGGWQLSGIYTFQSGSPINFGNVIYNGNFSGIPLSGSEQTLGRWFNTAGFEKGAALQLDRNIRTFPLRLSNVRTDIMNNWDLSAIKNTRFGEKWNAQFKAEFLNAFNTPLFPAPNTTPTVVAFGTIQPSTQANYPRRIQLTLKLLF